MKTISVSIDHVPQDVQVTAVEPQALLIATKTQLAKGIAHFAFKKTDGTLREAYGTINPQLIEHFLGPKVAGENKKAENPTQLIYFDIDAQGFRNFKIENLVILY